MFMSEVYLSIGGNLGDRLANLKRTVLGLEELPCTRKTAMSDIYMSAPWGFVHPRYFLNQVIRVETSMDPFTFLKATRNIEDALGRDHMLSHTEYVARTADIDILIFGTRIINDPQLLIPHPRFHKRNFVMCAMADMFPSLQHPLLKTDMKTLRRKTGDKAAVRKLNLISNIHEA